ncbi:MAG: nucleotidyltransferase family protein [Desulfuromonadaceae bacterium]|jgi:predicted nucleotidyltransferase|nr:nucleotidyltransferase family protein [Desulfuromonas sp.]MDY0184320.1 nucleotidyltransferase family protein [Desulfuromonadaceae bacterium]
MRAVGLITEYNPFHNGHAHHVEQARRCSGADVVVAVMGGHFLQRGEPSILGKWERARMALSCGVDVVVELPFPWACNSAPHFAAGALEVLNAFSPHLDCFCFGSESGNLQELQHLATVLTSLESVEHGGAAHFRHGQNYPTARQLHLERSKRELPASDLSISEEVVLNAPNNILALAYLRALGAAAHIRLLPLTIPRIGGSFHACRPTTAHIASATAVRHLLRADEDITPYVPGVCGRILRKAHQSGCLCNMQRWFMLVAGSCLREASASTSTASATPTSTPIPTQIYQYQPGLNERVLQAALEAGTYTELVEGVKARHLTRTRVQRLLCYTALGVTAAEMEPQLSGGVPFIPLLGATAKGEAFLRQCRNGMDIPLSGNFSRLSAMLKRHYRANPVRLAQAQQLLELHKRATRMYTLLLPGWNDISRHLDYHRDPLRPDSLFSSQP